ncbi:MAG: hypothetical protein QX189_20045 [Methylococcales bacterium]
MSKRTSIIKALTEKFKLIDGNAPYSSNIYNNAYAKLKFWDEVQDFPSLYATPGSETREYLPGNFTWAYLGVSLKVYCKGEDAQEQLELLLEDVETVIDANRVLIYDEVNHYETTEILVASITTDEGLLAPYAVGEINLQVRYALQ